MLGVLGAMGACQPTRMSGQRLAKLQTTVHLFGDSIPRRWSGNDTVYINYCKARAMDGCVKVYPLGDSLIAEWFTYYNSSTSGPIDFLWMKTFYKMNHNKWRRIIRMAAPQARVADQLNRYFYKLPVFKGQQVYTEVDTYLLTSAYSTTLIIDHSTEMNVATQLQQLFLP
jgi:hypothetical protein